MRILAISGSLRADSWNTTLLRAAAELLPPGVEVELHESLKPLPPFDEDDEHDPHGTVRALRAAIASADALIIATPGVQLVHSRAAEERRRLGLSPGHRPRTQGQGHPRPGGKHRPVRCGLGAGGTAQDAHRGGCRST